MEASILSSNAFTKTIEVVSPVRIPACARNKRAGVRRIRESCGGQVIRCCQSGASSAPSPPPQEDEKWPYVSSDWRAFRARMVARENISMVVVNPDAASTSSDIPQPIKIGDKWIHPIHEPEKGCLLIATEKLDGVHIFERTVILLLSTGGPIGPTGLILNRPSLMSIKEMRSSSALLGGHVSSSSSGGIFSDRPLYFGGPLEDGLFLVSPEDGATQEETNDVVGKSGVFEEVMRGLYYGTKVSVGCAAEMVKRDVVRGRELRFFDGYCAWEREQLRREIRAGYWTLAASSRDVVGLTTGLWEETLGLLGPRKVW